MRKLVLLLLLTFTAISCSNEEEEVYCNNNCYEVMWKSGVQIDNLFGARYFDIRLQNTCDKFDEYTVRVWDLDAYDSNDYWSKDVLCGSEIPLGTKLD